METLENLIYREMRNRHDGFFELEYHADHGGNIDIHIGHFNPDNYEHQTVHACGTTVRLRAEKKDISELLEEFLKKYEKALPRISALIEGAQKKHKKMLELISAHLRRGPNYHKITITDSIDLFFINVSVFDTEKNKKPFRKLNFSIVKEKKDPFAIAEEFDALFEKEFYKK